MRGTLQDLYKNFDNITIGFSLPLVFLSLLLHRKRDLDAQGAFIVYIKGIPWIFDKKV